MIKRLLHPAKNPQPTAAVARPSRAIAAALAATCRVALISAFCFLLSAFTAPGAVVTNLITDIYGTPISGRTIKFLPRSTPNNFTWNGTNGTVMDLAKQTITTNGGWSAGFMGGFYDADFGTINGTQPTRPVRFFVPPNDTNTYSFNDCCAFATNASIVTWNGYNPMATTNVNNAIGTNVHLTGNFFDTNGAPITGGTSSGTSTSAVQQIVIDMGTVTNNQPIVSFGTGSLVSGSVIGNVQFVDNNIFDWADDLVYDSTNHVVPLERLPVTVTTNVTLTTLGGLTNKVVNSGHSIAITIGNTNSGTTFTNFSGTIGAGGILGNGIDTNLSSTQLAAAGVVTTNTVRLETNWLSALESALPYTLATNAFKLEDCSDTNANQIYYSAGYYSNNVNDRGWYFTNTANNYTIQSTIAIGTYLEQSFSIGGYYQAYLPGTALNAQGSNPSLTNLFTAFWNRIGGAYEPRMVAKALIVSTRFGGQQADGLFVGTNFGSSDVDFLYSSRHGTPTPPLDSSWNAQSAPVPYIFLAQWPSMYNTADLTNSVQQCVQYHAIIDAYAWDISVLARTNGLLVPYPVGTSPWGTVNFPEGIPFLSNWLLTNGILPTFGLERYPLKKYPGWPLSLSTNYPNAYEYSTPAQLESDISRLFDVFGARGVNTDHFYGNPSRAEVYQTEYSFSAALYRAIQNKMASTNYTANNQVGWAFRPFPVLYWALSKEDYVLNTVNTLTIGDLYLNSNGTAQKTGAAAETNYLQYVSQMTNFATWSKPGKTIFGGDIDNQVAGADLTNSFNLHCILAASMGITTQAGKMTNTQPIFIALTNRTLINTVLKDPLVKMGLPVAQLQTNSDSKTVELWVRPLNEPFKFAVMVWNHSGVATNCTIPFATANAGLAGTVVVTDPWAQANVATNTSSQTVSLGAYETKLFIYKKSSTDFTGTLSGDASGLTNLPASQLTGTVPDANLSNNIARLNVDAAFKGSILSDGMNLAKTNIIGFTNTSNGGFRSRYDFDGGYSGIQSGSGVALQVYAYYGVIIQGNRRNPAPSWVAGAAAGTSLTVVGFTAGSSVLDVQGASSQTGNLQNWKNSSGTNLISISSDGNLFFRTNTTCPIPQSDGAYLWNSNNTFFKVTTTGTNFAF